MRRTTTIMVLLVLLAVFRASAENLVNLSIGPAWPRVLLDEPARKTAGSAHIEYGYVFDRKIGLGVGAGFSWNTRTDREQVQENVWRDTLRRSSYMFPVFGFFVADPLSYLLVHPSLKFQIGYNSLAYTSSSIQNGELTKDDVQSGYYYGFYARLALDANYDFGEIAGILAGVSYQWANTRSASENAGLYSERNMSALGLHAGVRFLF